MKRVHPIHSSGFTLFEILITLFIFSVLVSTIFTAYSGTLRTVHKTEAITDAYDQARIALERICEDLESCYIPEDVETPAEGKTPQQQALFVGAASETGDQAIDILRFLSLAHIGFDGTSSMAQPTEIIYYVKQDHPEAPATLYRSDTPLWQERPETGTGGFPLCEGLSAVYFTYYDAEGTLHESWESMAMGSEQRMPSRVSVLLEFATETHPPLRFRTGVVIPARGKGEFFER
ncbi:MAG: prepilin-type N-terminal cleavage/methylation domain-containing protein [Desulfatiglandaceae bacterium]